MPNLAEPPKERCRQSQKGLYKFSAPENSGTGLEI